MRFAASTGLPISPGGWVIGRPMIKTSAPARTASAGESTRFWSLAAAHRGRIPGVQSSAESSSGMLRRSCASLAEQMMAWPPSDTKVRANCGTLMSAAAPKISVHSASSSEVRTVTPKTLLLPAASTAAWMDVVQFPVYEQHRAGALQGCQHSWRAFSMQKSQPDLEVVHLLVQRFHKP